MGASVAHVRATPCRCRLARLPLGRGISALLPAAVGVAAATVSCAPLGARSELSLEILSIRRRPRFNGEGVEPGGPPVPGNEWFERRSEALIHYRLRLPHGFELGAGVGPAEYSLGRVGTYGGEDGVLGWRAEAAWEAGTRTVFRAGARYEAVEDAHVLGYEPRPDDSRYELAGWIVYGEIGTAFRGLCVFAGAAQVVSESSYLACFPGSTAVMLDFGLESRTTYAYLGCRTPGRSAGPVGRLELALPVDGKPISYHAIAASVGFRF